MEDNEKNEMKKLEVSPLEKLEVYSGETKMYQEKIISMVDQIKDEKFIKMIYGYVGSAYREEKSRG